MSLAHEERASKRPVNVTVNSELLTQARALDINLSAVLETALEALIRSRLEEQWREENRPAFDAYNKYVDEHGVFSAGLRSF